MRSRWTFPLLVLATGAIGQVRINEACSKNVVGTADGDDFPDWIELHNPGSDAIDLAGLFLSDDPTLPLKWALPVEQLAAGGYLLLFEGNDNDDGHHFDFKLSQEGETIYLVNSGAVIMDSLPMPFLRADHSFG
ncbi:MAG: lamin tail domain-containing protein, partial [Flavobacteriales bacterium]|nr:lamin tail domain-containing protein [Flavobacteriales bacterium]